MTPATAPAASTAPANPMALAAPAVSTGPAAPVGTAVPQATWEQLRSLAVRAAATAYAPYSRFRVGAAALVDDGRVVTGCNVENASYGLTLCAECALVCDLVRGGGGRLVALVCVDATGRPCAPCGRCRQVLAEHAADRMELAMPSGTMTMDEVLPDAFGRASMTRPPAPRTRPHAPQETL